MSAPEIKFIGELQRVDVKPGDRFVMMTERPIRREEFEMLQGMWRGFIGSDENKLLVLDHGCRLGVVGAEAVPETRYLVWSNEHNAWWRANSQGYSRSILGAGIYSREEAIDIADKSRNGWSVAERPDEIAVALADIPAKIRAVVLANAEADKP